MSKYKGLFTFDADNHKYVSVEQADGIIGDMNYRPEPEEPEEYWYMTAWGDVKEYSQDQFAIEQKRAIGNYFETKEEAKKVVERLRAWKRLKDKGFRFTGVEDIERTIHFELPFRAGYDSCEAEADLDLLFSGGEE